MPDDTPTTPLTPTTPGTPQGAGGGFGGGGGGPLYPSENPSLPDQPHDCPEFAVADNAVLRSAADMYNLVFNFIKCKTGWNLLGHVAGMLAAAPIFVVGAVIGIGMAPLAKIMATAGTIVLELLGETRKTVAPDLDKLMIATLNEMFGAEFTAADLPGAGDSAAALKRARVLGDKVISQLEHEFAPDGKINPEQGQLAAKAFSGFVVNFSVVSSFIAILGEMVTAGQLESFRELGVELAENLGLGRMARRGISEMVSVTVADPYEWYLNKKYRPKLLGASQGTRAWLAGHMTSVQLRDELAMQGFDEFKISALIQQALQDLSPKQIGALLSIGRITETDAQVMLSRSGFSAEMIELYFEAEAAIAIEGVRNNLTSRVLGGFLDGEISAAEFDGVLTRLGVSDKLRGRINALAGELSRLPRRGLSLAQMREAFIHGTIDVSELEDFLIRVGYRQNDRQILIIEALLDLKDEEQRLKLKREREAARDAAREAAAAKAAPQP